MQPPKHLLSALLTTALLLPALSARAEQEPEHKLSITLSPIHLALPMVELTGEYAVQRKVGAAGIVGVGQVTVEDSLGSESTFTALELGAQGHYYALGDFDHGLQLGLEALYLYVSGDSDSDSSVSGTGAGLALGPYVGYKFAASFGLTFNAQAGVQYLVVKADAEDADTGETAEDGDSEVIPLLNLNVGWSF
jgi:hypothetical protein